MACLRSALTLLVLLTGLATAPARAVDPELRLEDPKLEARAVAITRQLRCPTCVSQSVADSNVGISRDLQALVRERVLAGDTNAEIIAYVEARYGEFVLLKPKVNAFNAALWGLPLILFAGAGLWLTARRRRAPATVSNATLTEEEQKALEALRGEGHS